MNRSQFAVLISIVLFTVLIITNPKEEEHKAVVKNKLTTFLQKGLKNSAKSEDLLGMMGKGLGLLFGGYIVDKVADNVSRENYFVVSTTTLTWEGKTETIGLGILGNVFLSPKIDKELDNMLQEKQSKTSNVDRLKHDIKQTPTLPRSRVGTFLDEKVDEKPTNGVDESMDNSNEPSSMQSDTQYKEGVYVIAGYLNDRVRFHDSPNEATQRNAYLVADQKVYVQKVQNGFGYVEYTNSYGHVTKGWLDMHFLILQTP